MKRFFTLITALTSALAAFAQGYLTVDFGSDTNTVRRFLESRNAKITLASDGTLHATTDDLHATYYFNEGFLYEFRVEKNFRNRRGADEAYTDFLNHFKGLSLSYSETVSETEITLVTVKQNELNVVTQCDCQEGNTVKHKAIGLDWQPGANLSTALAAREGQSPLAMK